MMMSYWITAACQGARKEAGLGMEHIAEVASIDCKEVETFEAIGGWGRQMDMLIEAYAEACSVDPIDLWAKAYVSLLDDERAEHVDSFLSVMADKRLGIFEIVRGTLLDLQQRLDRIERRLLVEETGEVAAETAVDGDGSVA